MFAAARANYQDLQFMLLVGQIVNLRPVVNRPVKLSFQAAGRLQSAAD